jgi:hypothetical protein
MQEGEDLPLNLSSRWQLKGCECAPRTARISQKTSFSRRVQPQKANAPEQVRPVLAQALSHPGPALVEVVVDRQELALPPPIKLDQVKGFSLFMMKAVINGRGSEVIDLLKTNLF